MRERLDEICAFERPSASEGERRAAEWLADELREAGAREVRIEEEPGANGTFWWPIGLLAGAGAVAGLAARRGGRFARLLAAATGVAASALIADEMPPGRRRFRRLLPKRTCHHVLAEIFGKKRAFYGYASLIFSTSLAAALAPAFAIDLLIGLTAVCVGFVTAKHVLGQRRIAKLSGTAPPRAAAIPLERNLAHGSASLLSGRQTDF